MAEACGGGTTTDDAEEPSSPCAANFTALWLVIPGLGLYVYILFTMFSKLVYPASFQPFMEQLPPELLSPAAAEEDGAVATGTVINVFLT